MNIENQEIITSFDGNVFKTRKQCKLYEQGIKDLIIKIIKNEKDWFEDQGYLLVNINIFGEIELTDLDGNEPHGNLTIDKLDLVEHIFRLSDKYNFELNIPNMYYNVKEMELK